MVEAPGYCPPGPKCLFHLTVYRHSRLPGTDADRDFSLESQEPRCYAQASNRSIGVGKHMKKLVFAVSAAALALAACSGNNEDSVNNAELNQPTAEDLNALSNQAAMDAANSEAAARGNQQNELDQNAAATDNAVNPQEADEQNVSGM